MPSGFLVEYEKRWEDIQERGVLPEVTTLEEYARRYQENLLTIHEELADRRDMITNPSELKDLHRLLFQNITPWAGQFAEEQMVVYGISTQPPARLVSFQGVRPELAEAEFTLLGLQIDKLEKQVKRTSQAELIRLVAFQHARFQHIHAFPDGNGRLGRILVEHAMGLITRQAPSLQIDRVDYSRCLTGSMLTGNIALLSDMLNRAYLLKNDAIGYLPTPYVLAPQTNKLGASDTLKMSQREPLKIIGAKAPPLERRWFLETDWVKMLDLPKAHVTPNFFKADRFMASIQAKRQSFGDAIMNIRKIQLMEPYRLAVESPEEASKRYVRFADRLFGSAFWAMTAESQSTLTQAYTDLFVRSAPLRAEYFNELYTKAEYQIGELPSHVSQVPIDTFRQQGAPQIGPEEKKRRGHRKGQ